MGKIAFDTDPGRELLMLCILGPIVQREGLTTLCWQSPETVDHRSVGLSGGLAGQLANQYKPALALSQGIYGRLALPGDEAIAFPVTILAATLNGLWSGINRNPVGNLGFSHFSADALVPPLLVGTA